MLKVIIATVVCFLAVPCLGALLGGVQLVFYRMRVRSGRMKSEDIPFFGALLLRGMIAVFALGAVFAVLANLAAQPAH